MRKFILTKRKAIGLIEVLIAMAISAMVLLGAVVVSSKSIKAVKKSELEDMTNAVLIQSLEISRSPVNFDLNTTLGDGRGPTYFTLVKDSNGEYKLEEANFGVGEISTCDSKSPYKVNILDFDDAAQYADDDFLENYVICNQIEIREANRDASRRQFQIRSIMVYELFQQDVKAELTSYRTETIN